MKKSILRKSCSRLGETLIFKVSVQIVAKFRAPKMDAKSDMEKKVHKIRKKRLRACILALRTPFWTAQDAPGTSQERPKSGSRGPQELSTRPVGRSVMLSGALGALLGAFLRFFVISLSFLVDLCYEFG